MEKYNYHEKRRPLNAGILLNERYQIQQTLSYGGFGIVYKGLDIQTRKIVVIKEMFPIGRAYRNEDSLHYMDYYQKYCYELYQNETSILKKVKNIEGCMKIIESFRANGTFYIVSDNIQGNTLQKNIEFGMAHRLLKLVLLRLCKIISEIHQLNILHRDICPDNIIVRPEGECVILDFGSAIDLTKKNSEFIKETTYRIGFSPQTFLNGQDALNKRVDLFSVSAVLFYGLTHTQVQSKKKEMDWEKITKELRRVGQSEYLIYEICNGLKLENDVSYDCMSRLMSCLQKERNECI